MTQAPTIDTQRLTLRQHRIEDFDAYAALWASERAIYMGGPLDRRGAWNWFTSDVAQWALFGFGAWAVDMRDGTNIGQVVLQKPDHFPEVEIGYVLYDGFEGQGFMIEAVEAARGYAYADLGMETLVSYIDPKNTRSVALATKLGAQRDATAALPVGETEDDTHVYRHPMPEAILDGGMEAYA